MTEDFFLFINPCETWRKLPSLHGSDKFYQTANFAANKISWMGQLNLIPTPMRKNRERNVTNTQSENFIQIHSFYAMHFHAFHSSKLARIQLCCTQFFRNILFYYHNSVDNFIVLTIYSLLMHLKCHFFYYVDYSLDAFYNFKLECFQLCNTILETSWWLYNTYNLFV